MSSAQILCLQCKQDLSYVSTFNTEETPNALAFVAKDALKIGSMESIQRLHIKTVPLGETPRRIAYQEQNRIFGLLTTKVLPSEEDELSSFKIVDDQTYESEASFLHSFHLNSLTIYSVIDNFALEKYEVAQSLVSCDFSDRENPVFVAGTAFVIPSEEEPSKGRLLVFKMNKQRKISLLYETDTKGCVYSLCAFEADKIVAGINARVCLSLSIYSLTYSLRVF